ncbi:MAG: DUF3488 and DUF4129 domain-containing transglutaminase family protein [Leptolyngbyaceae cyanobacterium bins.59]|nr:DUF3488 and DUF4129 domain-containing transglutaminase family protein [Leptolyngbyaceae cyanobacterium bins.59]
MSSTLKKTPRSPDRSPANPSSLSNLQTEESILLRILTQSLVIVGIIATDIAASAVTEWQVTSYWAIPISIVGSYWSWHRRKYRNIATKFLLAIGMLWTLYAFLSRVLGFGDGMNELNDTRLALAQLLIQLQVLHSFDLPRRKDLGYSMVIGLILLGVAGTLSQTLAFGPFLLLFVMLALPVLVLDYRSRLGLVLRSLRTTGTGLAPKRLGLFLVAIVALGMAIFLCLPRLPGYQIRSYPVSAANLQERLQQNRSFNPGYVGRGRRGDQGSGGDETQPGEGTGPGGVPTPTKGPGKLDPDYYYGFDTQINQNLRGELKPKVMFRVRSQAEGFWRVMAFDKYTGQGWEISRNDQSKTVNRPSWTYQFYLPTQVLIRRFKEIVQTYTIVSEEFPNVVPALFQPNELYFPTPQIGVDPEGSLRSPLALREGDTYTVISRVPFRDRTRLRQESTNYSSAIRRYYLQLPTKFNDRIRQLTEEILAKAPNPLNDPYEKTLYLTQYLKQNYQVLPELPFWGDNEDMVEAFLLLYKGGYADHFSTTLTMMLRSIGIPARLITGFGSGEFNPFTGFYIVRNTDAYALTEVYFPNNGWFAFDPIPGHDLYPPSIEPGQTFTVLQRFWQWIAGWLPSPLVGVFNRLFNIIGYGIAWLLGLFSQGWVGLFTALLLAAVTGFLGWLSWLTWRSWRYQRWLSRLHPMESLYQQMLGWLAEKGFPRKPMETPYEYAYRVQREYPGPTDMMNDISEAYVRWRYGGQAVSVPDLEAKFREFKQRSASNPLRRKARSVATSSSKS